MSFIERVQTTKVSHFKIRTSRKRFKKSSFHCREVGTFLPLTFEANASKICLADNTNILAAMSVEDVFLMTNNPNVELLHSTEPFPRKLSRDFYSKQSAFGGTEISEDTNTHSKI